MTTANKKKTNGDHYYDYRVTPRSCSIGTEESSLSDCGGGERPAATEEEQAKTTQAAAEAEAQATKAKAAEAEAAAAAEGGGLSSHPFLQLLFAPDDANAAAAVQETFRFSSVPYQVDRSSCVRFRRQRRASVEARSTWTPSCVLRTEWTYGVVDPKALARGRRGERCRDVYSERKVMAEYNREEGRIQVWVDGVTVMNQGGLTPPFEAFFRPSPPLPPSRSRSQKRDNRDVSAMQRAMTMKVICTAATTGADGKVGGGRRHRDRIALDLHVNGLSFEYDMPRIYELGMCPWEVQDMEGEWDEEGEEEEENDDNGDSRNSHANRDNKCNKDEDTIFIYEEGGILGMRRRKEKRRSRRQWKGGGERTGGRCPPREIFLESSAEMLQAKEEGIRHPMGVEGTTPIPRSNKDAAAHWILALTAFHLLLMVTERGWRGMCCSSLWHTPMTVRDIPDRNGNDLSLLHFALISSMIFILLHRWAELIAASKERERERRGEEDKCGGMEVDQCIVRLDRQPSDMSWDC